METTRHSVQPFEALFSRFYEPLCRFAAHILGDNQIAEELVDDVFLNLWELEIEPSNVTKAYLYTSVRNSCLNELKSTRHRFQQKCSTVDEQERAELLSYIFQDSRHPLGVLLQQELEQKISDAISNLPPECKQVFLKSRKENKTYQEIASELGISINTVKYHIKTAIASLSRSLSPYLLHMMVCFFLRKIEF